MRTWSCKARSQGDNEISIQKNREPRYPIGMNSLNASIYLYWESKDTDDLPIFRD